jgi:hypothetical protein
MTTEPAAGSEGARLSRAVRFGLAALVIGLSYPNIHCAVAITHFRDMYDGMGVQKVSRTAAFLFAHRPLFVGLSILLPLAAVVSIFTRDKVRSIYLSGFLVIAVFVQLFFTWFTLTAPLWGLIGDVAK